MRENVKKSNYGLIWQHILLSAGSLASLKINIMSERWGEGGGGEKTGKGTEKGVWFTDTPRVQNETNFHFHTIRKM